MAPTSARSPSPIACSRFCGGSNDVYRFTVDAAQAGSGPHTMVNTATDASGSSRSLTVAVPVSNAPGLALTSPADGALVFGSLRVTGTATSDKPGAVSTTARLGDLEFLSTAASSFSGGFDLTGITPGNCTLTVRSTDSTGQTGQTQRTVVVTSSAALAYPPAFTLPTGGHLLAADGNQVLYASGDGSVLLRDLVAANEVALNGASSIQYVSGWRLDAGRVVAFGKGADWVLYCVYLWTSSGSRSNLTNPNPYSRASNFGGGWAYGRGRPTSPVGRWCSRWGCRCTGWGWNMPPALQKRDPPKERRDDLRGLRGVHPGRNRTSVFLRIQQLAQQSSAHLLYS